MQVRVSALLLVAAVAWCAHAHMDGDCAPPPADYGQLAMCNAFHADSLPDYLGMTREEVLNRLAEDGTSTVDAIHEAYEELRQEQLGEEQGEDAVLQARKTPVVSGHSTTDAALTTKVWNYFQNFWCLVRRDASSTAAALTVKVWNYYHLVCPRSYYWLGVTQWFFYNWYNGGYQYCWSYIPIWVTACQNPYCAWWFTNPYLMYYYYRCYPVYRVVHVWARCFTYTGTASDYTVTWYEKRYIRLYVPRDCCCRRYLNPWITAATCDAPGK